MLNKIIPTINGTGPAPVPASTTTTEPTARKPRGPRPIKGAAKAVSEMMRIRQTYKLSQSQVADKLDVHFSCVSRWETRGTLPRSGTLTKLHEFNAAYADGAPKDEPKSQEIVVKRFNRPPLRFKGKLLGSDHFSGKTITLWRTEAGTYVWQLKNDADYGSAQKFEAWAKKLWPNILTSQRQTQAVLSWAYDMGLEIFEDIA